MNKKHNRSKVGGTTAYSYKTLPKGSKDKLGSQRVDSSWDNPERWANYEHQKLQNKIADDKVHDTYINALERVNKAQGDAILKIMKAHKRRNAFDDFLDGEDN